MLLGEVGQLELLAWQAWVALVRLGEPGRAGQVGQAKQGVVLLLLRPAQVLLVRLERSEVFAGKPG